MQEEVAGAKASCYVAQARCQPWVWLRSLVRSLARMGSHGLNGLGRRRHCSTSELSSRNRQAGTGLGAGWVDGGVNERDGEMRKRIKGELR
jgi:hypothetical protein